ncbi:MAG TPA: haloacid dehalogenase, partial [Phytomonospora sp.]
MHGLTRLFAGPGPILLDFDGPVCAVFAGRPAPEVAARLAAAFGVAGTGDPLEVLRRADAHGDPALTRAVDDALTAEELAAVASAVPTEGAAALIGAAHAAGKRVAVVSNNGRPAITRYLDAHELTVDAVVGRAPGSPGEMKPSPL